MAIVKSAGKFSFSMVKSLFRYPKLLAPLLLIWPLFAGTVLYLKYGTHFNQLSLSINFLIVFAAIFFFSLLLSTSCLVVLDMLQEIEHNRKPSLLKSTWKMLSKDFIRALPIMIVWSILWSILTVIDAIFSKRDNKNSDSTDAESIAKTVGGYQSFSLFRLTIDAIEKGIRMVIFLIYPAIAWEKLSSLKGTKKGLSVLKAHLAQFGTAYVTSGAIATVIFLPPALLFYAHEKLHVYMATSVWVGTIIYIGLAWSAAMFVEQVFMANLYLWHLKWEKAVVDAKQSGQAIPNINDVEMPSLIQNDESFLAS